MTTAVGVCLGFGTLVLLFRAVLSAPRSVQCFPLTSPVLTCNVCGNVCCAVSCCACRYTPEQCEELLKNESAFKALLKDAIKGSPVSDDNGKGGRLEGRCVC
jgi:hypothetical protein